MHHRLTRIAAPALLAGFLATMSGCASQNQKISALETRIASLEASNAKVSKAEQRLAAMEAVVRGLETTVAGMQATFGKLGESFEQIDGKLERIAQQLDNIKTPSPARRPANRPDPKVVYSVPVAGSPTLGPKNAKVTLVRMFEFACPYCERSRATMKQLRQQYGRDLRIVYKHFIIHPNKATLPAKAACAAHKQKRFADMEEELWEKAYKQGRNFSQQNIDAIARGIGLNMKRFRRDLQSPQCAKRVTDDQAMAAKVGVRGTPAFYVNGRFLSGARPVHQFQKLIDEELAKANRVIRSGKVKQRNYYKHVVKNGKKKL